MYRAVQGLLSLLMILAYSGETFAVAPNQCGSFTVYSDGSARKVTYVDRAPDGKSVGDQRIGYRAIKDADGEQVGEQRWIATVVEVAESADQKDQTASESVFVFPEGHIFATRPAAPTHAPPENTQKVAGRGDLIILGGSGVFQGARGVVKREAEASTTTPYVFDIRCD